MKLTVINSHDGMMRVHKEGCADIKRESRNANGHFHAEETTLEGIVRNVWQDFITPGSDDISSYWRSTHFAPCVPLPSQPPRALPTLNVVRKNWTSDTTGPVLEFLGAQTISGLNTLVWLRKEDGKPFPVKMTTFQSYYAAWPLQELSPVAERPVVEQPIQATATRSYAVVYARGAAHLQGLSEVVRDRGTEDAPEWTYSACPALSKNRTQWTTAWRGTDLATALEELESCGKHRAKGVCKTCAKKGKAQLDASMASTVAELIENQTGTDWAAYDDCPKCLVAAGQVCKGIVPRRGEGGLGHNGQRPLKRAHKERPKLGGPAVLRELLTLES